MRPPRLSEAEIEKHLALALPETREIVMALREVVLTAAPGAAEAIRFGCLAYFHPDARYGSIGGNICMIEVHEGAVTLSFIQGAGLPDPHGLLQGPAKFKRLVPIPDVGAARDPHVLELIRVSAE